MINVTEEIKHLHKLAIENSSKRFAKLWENLISVEWLAQAWEQIRHNKGSRTSGIDKMADDAIDLEFIHKLSGKLIQGRYRPKPVRRVLIPKSNGKTRPLGIPTLEDRIVQQVILASYIGISRAFGATGKLTVKWQDEPANFACQSIRH